jgi:uncharacterized lipoprotein YehR (DUF1307 family)
MLKLHLNQESTKMKNTIYLLAVAIIFTLASCSKTTRYSKQLTGEKWAISAFTVDGTPHEELPHLEFADCDIYDESCTGELVTHEGGVAHFIWQIRDQGDTFEYSDQTDHTHSDLDHHAIEISAAISGVFSIEERSRKNMTLQSTALNGFKGKTVIIELTKE